MNSPASERILIASANTDYINRLQTTLESKGHVVDRTLSGKDTQGMLYRQSYSLLVLDLELSNFSSIEILKYIKISKQSLKVLLFVDQKQLLMDFNLDKPKLLRLGVIDSVFSTMTPEKVVEKIKSFTHATSWKNVKQNETRSDAKECKIVDADLTRVSIKEALQANIAVFDHYLKLAPNKYVKVVHQGEPFPASVIESYADAGAEFLYFLTKDRVIYINYMNELSEKMIKSSKVSAPKIFNSIKNTADKYIEEIYTQGIKPDMVSEGKRICQNIFSMVTKDNNLKDIMLSMEEVDPASFSHSFLVSFYSMVICKNVEWVGTKTIDTIALGSLLHDIGLLKLPSNIRESRGKNLSAKDFAQFKLHPKLGAEMLQNSPIINEQVRQIVYQHHELVTGTGFPNELTGLKIYPLAKIVSLAGGFSDLLIETKLPPKEAMKIFLQDRTNFMKYDSNLVRSLVYGLI